MREGKTNNSKANKHTKKEKRWCLAAAKMDYKERGAGCQSQDQSTRLLIARKTTTIMIISIVNSEKKNPTDLATINAVMETKTGNNNSNSIAKQLKSQREREERKKTDYNGGASPGFELLSC
jgi:hypothetical protein